MIVPPATIGVLGGGQLGRYTVVAARLMGYGTIVLDPDPSAPAGRVADEHLAAPYDDPDALDQLAARCAVVTTEFENPPAAALERLAADVRRRPAGGGGGDRPGPHQREALPRRHRRADGAVRRARRGRRFRCRRSSRRPAWATTARASARVETAAALTAALAELAVPCIVETRVPLDVEISVIVARAAGGSVVAYPVAENHHVDGILDLTVVPARVSPALAAEAVALAERIAGALDYVGVLAVEMFVSDGRLLVNELAPRPHNSGHWTLDAAVTSQFEQQVRAVCGLALGPHRPDDRRGGDGQPARRPVGGRRAGVERRARPSPTPGCTSTASRQPRPGRKMGHLTVLGDDADAQSPDRRASTLRDRSSRHVDADRVWPMA